MNEPPFWTFSLSPYSAIKIWTLVALTFACREGLTLESNAAKRESRILWGVIA